MDFKEDLKYVSFIVHKYLEDKPEVAHLRGELEQEGTLAYLKALEDYDSSRGVDKKLFVYYRVLYVLKTYLRKESKHFRKPYDAEDPKGLSPYWPLSEYVDVEDIAIDIDIDSSILELLSYLKLSDRANSIIISYLKTGSYADTAKEFNITRQGVKKTVDSFIEKSKEQLKRDKV